MDRMGEGILSTYKSHGTRITPRRRRRGLPRRQAYLVAAFDEADKQRFELSFGKMSMGPKNAACVYGVRVGDLQDYRAMAREFLDTNSSGIVALEGSALSDLDALPRQCSETYCASFTQRKPMVGSWRQSAGGRGVRHRSSDPGPPGS